MVCDNTYTFVFSHSALRRGSLECWKAPSPVHDKLFAGEEWMVQAGSMPSSRKLYKGKEARIDPGASGGQWGLTGASEMPCIPGLR